MNSKPDSRKFALLILRMRGILLLFLLPVTVFSSANSRAEESGMSVGVAQIDITPDYPVRLNGFGFRRAESEGITQKIWTKALAFHDPTNGPAILITCDNLCITGEITDEIARRLSLKAGVKPGRLTITATHTHTAPMLRNAAPAIFSTDIPADHQERIDRYTRELTDNLEKVALAAIEDIKPARLSWGIGKVGFAVNRRTKGGPVDHDLPALVVAGLDGKPRGIYFSYACHCVTLSNNKISGDWAGYAQEAIQKEHPGVIALASVGCGADSNPNARATAEDPEASARQGAEIASEIRSMLKGVLRPVLTPPQTMLSNLDLAFDAPRTRSEWEGRATNANQAIAYHARLNLRRMDRREPIPTELRYPIQTWWFGNDLAMIFLPGETVVDYSLRLKKEFDRFRIWVHGYSNDGRCYIPSERILKEGGYEGGGAMVYYDMPQSFAPGLEQKIIDQVRRQMPAGYAALEGTEGTRPVSPDESLKLLHAKPGLKIELVASEPLIASPVAIDWGLDGRLWVCEMRDYPSGLDQNWKPGGQIKILKDGDGDGRYDEAIVFLDNLPFPTGVMVWGKGAFICSAPDILYAEDTDGDGKADKVEKIFTGFVTENFQARVNGLTLGLDNWIHGANGLLGGVISGPSLKENTVNIRNRDFRFDPAARRFEPATGISQQGRTRDDWDNWFGCDNSRLLLHYSAEDRYLRRNPSMPSFQPVIHLEEAAGRAHLFPRSRLQDRFNDPDNANKVTAACGVAIYRDVWLGKEYEDNAFICEPVHNLVHRKILKRDGSQLTAGRAADEKTSEFLASEDNWFRPVQARTGPDGALYIVDYYRFLIEHPRWIPAARLAQIDIRAGADRGRIYRVLPDGKSAEPILNLTDFKGENLVSRLETRNGTERDRVHMAMLEKPVTENVPALERMVLKSELPQARGQALSVLNGLNLLKPEVLTLAVKDRDSRVRQLAVRTSESFLSLRNPALISALLSLTNDPSPLVLEQLAFTLGEWSDPRAGAALAELARASMESSRMRIAVLSSAPVHGSDILTGLQKNGVGLKSDWMEPLLMAAAKSTNDHFIKKSLRHLVRECSENPALAPNFWRFLSSLNESSGQRGVHLDSLLNTESDRKVLESGIAKTWIEARQILADENSDESSRATALSLIGSEEQNAADRALLSQLAADRSEKLRRSAQEILARQKATDVPGNLLARWPSTFPRAREEIISLLLSREDWTISLLKAVRSGKVERNEISLAQRQQLLSSSIKETSDLAGSLFPVISNRNREKTAEHYLSNLGLGRAEKGAEIFATACSSCHLFKGRGFALGPDLEQLKNRDEGFWLKSILDPNAVVEPRFMTYQVSLRDDRTFLGIIRDETAGEVTVEMPGGIREKVQRSHILEILPQKLSIMPEGFEDFISTADMAHLMAFLKKPPGVDEVRAGEFSPNPDTSGEVLRNPAAVAKLILDSRQSSNIRETAIRSNPQFASELIVEITRDLTFPSPEEYMRIPWIWRVAVDCGKRNDPAPIQKLLNVSLPRNNEPLRDWQAVVIGGGIINGISERGFWPASRVEEIIGSDSLLRSRWLRALELSSAMADDVKVPSGTRYDALRMLAMEPWEKRGQQLVRYLTYKDDVEIQMGAVSALGDLDHPESAQALINVLPDLADRNRQLAAQALLRSDSRKKLLLDAIKTGRLTVRDLGDEVMKQLRSQNSR